jgi:hypothetical protein
VFEAPAGAGTSIGVCGDMVMGCFVLTLQLDPGPKYDFVSASNNVVWNVGKVALRYGRGA